MHSNSFLSATIIVENEIVQDVARDEANDTNTSLSKRELLNENL